MDRKFFPAAVGIVNLDSQRSVAGHLRWRDSSQVKSVPELCLATADLVFNNNVVNGGPVGCRSVGRKFHKSALTRAQSTLGAHSLIEHDIYCGRNEFERVCIAVRS